jgi:hypothetical protein
VGGGGRCKGLKEYRVGGLAPGFSLHFWQPRLSRAPLFRLWVFFRFLLLLNSLLLNTMMRNSRAYSREKQFLLSIHNITQESTLYNGTHISS